MKQFSRQKQKKTKEGIVKKPSNTSNPRIDMGDVLSSFLSFLNDDFGRLNNSIAHEDNCKTFVYSRAIADCQKI